MARNNSPLLDVQEPVWYLDVLDRLTFDRLEVDSRKRLWATAGEAFENYADAKTKYKPQPALEWFFKTLWYGKVVEFAVSVLVFVLAWIGEAWCGSAAMVVFGGLALAWEYVLYQRSAIVLSNWWWKLLSFAPNYIQILATTSFAGESFSTWSRGDTAERFAETWARVPLIGPCIGATGVPALLTLLILLDMVLHFKFMAKSWKAAYTEAKWAGVNQAQGAESADALEVTIGNFHSNIASFCDAVNMQFLSEIIRSISNVTNPRRDTRFWSSLLIKYPMLWTKTSLFALAYDAASQGARVRGLVALGLSWYGIVQMLPRYWEMSDVVTWGKITWSLMTRRAKNVQTAVQVALYPEGHDLPVAAVLEDQYRFRFPEAYFQHPMFWILMMVLAHQALHLGGVWLCASHDLSIIRGCTPMIAAHA